MEVWLLSLLLYTPCVLSKQNTQKCVYYKDMSVFLLVPLAMPANLKVTPSSYSTLQVSWGAAPGATQYLILYSALSHGEPDDAKEVMTECVDYILLLVNDTEKSNTL